MIQEIQIKPLEVPGNNYFISFSVHETLDDFRKRGYQLKFRREITCLYCAELNEWIYPDNFTVDEYHHFEDHLDPDGDRIIYAISSLDGRKGFLVDACLVYEDNISPEMMQKLEWNYSNAKNNPNPKKLNA